MWSISGGRENQNSVHGFLQTLSVSLSFIDPVVMNSNEPQPDTTILTVMNLSHEYNYRLNPLSPSSRSLIKDNLEDHYNQHMHIYVCMHNHN